MGYWARSVPSTAILSIVLPVCSENQMLPSGPAAIESSELPTGGNEYWVTTPSLVIFPTLVSKPSLYQLLAPGPVVVSVGWVPGARSGDRGHSALVGIYPRLGRASLL